VPPPATAKVFHSPYYCTDFLSSVTFYMFHNCIRRTLGGDTLAFSEQLPKFAFHGRNATQDPCVTQVAYNIKHVTQATHKSENG